MTSISPNSMSLVNSHMYDMVDLRKCINEPKKYSKGSIMNIIDNNKDFTRFAYIIKLARLDGVLNDIQANFTVFVPSDKMINNISEGVFTNLDISNSRQIVLASILKHKITSELLSYNPSNYFITMNPTEKLFITNINNVTYISNKIKIIIKDIQATNGLIHVVDQLIWPTFI